MPAESPFLFPPFRLDPITERLWQGTQAILLRPQTFAVLHYLVTHPGQLVTKEALLDTLWPDTYVSEGVVKDSIWELRKALRDDPRAPRFIETVPRRGYRFIAPVSTASPVLSPESRVLSPESPFSHTLHPTPDTLSGRPRDGACATPCLVRQSLTR
jgi:DNA-binding winged helix-turn-helix (wHTH) protein